MKRPSKKPTPHTTAVLYARVSTQEQSTDGCSLAMQEMQLRHYAAMRGLTVAAMVIDAGVSGGTPLESRPGGQQIVTLVQRGAVAHVVALKLDRLFRDCEDCLHQTATWDKKQVALHLVDLGGQTLDTSSAMGRFFLTVMAGAAELEKNLIGERTSQAMQHKKRQGERVGAVPFGMALAADGIRLEPHPAEQHIIDTARAYRAAGLSLRAIATHLAENGYLSRTGKVFEAHAIDNMTREVA